VKHQVVLRFATYPHYQSRKKYELRWK
jgi:hypothetical protein